MSTKSQKAMRRAMFDRHANELPRSFVVEGQIQSIMVDVYHHNMKVKEATDRILEIIAVAMLSEEVVDARRAGEDSYVYGETDGWRHADIAGMKAALAAAGITQEGASE